uniref:hypothetical protein n=1 Tax=Escherichia coli TaxID=562 RepID=UPI000651B395|nr:hypothetical protein [Escherichia coli]
MLPSETMIWQPEFTDKTLSRKPGAVQPVPGEQETDITDGIRLSDWYYKYKKSSESNVKDLPE